VYILLRPHGRRQSTMSVRRRASFDSDSDSDSEDGFFEGYSIGGDAPANELPSPCKIRMNGNRRSFSERVDDLLRGKARDETHGEECQTPKRRRLVPLCAVTPATRRAPQSFNQKNTSLLLALNNANRDQKNTKGARAARGRSGLPS